MGARGTNYRLRELRRELRLRSFSLTDLVEMPLSEEEENDEELFGSLDSALEQRRQSQGANSSEGDRHDSECPDSCGRRQSEEHTRSTTALEKAGRGRRGRSRRLFRSLIDMSRASNAEHMSGLFALRGAGELLFDTTRAILRTHRRRSRQAILRELLESPEPGLQKPRKSVGQGVRGAGADYRTAQFGWRARGESPFIVPDDVVSLVREIEERDQSIAHECRQRSRLLDEYREHQQRYQSELEELKSLKSAETREPPVSTSNQNPANPKESGNQISENSKEGDLRRQLHRSIHAHEELISSIAIFLAKREQQPAIVDGGVELSSTQVLDIILALNSQLGNLLVCLYMLPLCF